MSLSERWQNRPALQRYLNRLRRELAPTTFSFQAEARDLGRVYVEFRVSRSVSSADLLGLTERSKPAPVGRLGTMAVNEALAQPKAGNLLIGDSGSGKTTLARRVARDLATRAGCLAELARTSVPNRLAGWMAACGFARMADFCTRFPVPFFLPLNPSVNNLEALESHLAGLLAGDGFADPMGFLKDRLQARSCAVFLDGLDEIVDQEDRAAVAHTIESFARCYPGNLVMVTCRRDALDLASGWSSFARLELLEFSSAQVEGFVRNWFQHDSGLAEGFLRARQADMHLRRHTSNPLWLTLSAEVFRRDGRVPAEGVALHRRALELALEHWEEQAPLSTHSFDLTVLKRVLSSIAFGMHEHGVRQVSLAELQERLGAILTTWSEADRGRLLAWLLRSTLFRRESPGRYALVHFTFQQFLVASHCHGLGNFHAVLGRAQAPGWREVMPLLAGLLCDPTKLLERLRELDLELAATALADARAVEPRVAGNELFRRAAREIVRDLCERHAHGGRAGLQAAAALSAIADWGAADHLAARERDGQGQPALTAMLVRLRTADDAELDRLWPARGPLLQRLHRGLGSGVPELDRAIMVALERLGFPLAQVPAGPFLTGVLRKACQNPSHPVDLREFWIGKYPVTNDQFSRFVEETGYRAEGDWRRTSEGSWSKTFVSGKEQHPVVNLTWNDIQSFCRWAGASLPSEAQWEKAARGTDGRAYPWGNRWDSSRCNTRESGRKGTTPVGTYPDGTSPCGCQDLAGNVWEWTRGLEGDPLHEAKDARPDVLAEGNRVLKGGSWFNDRSFAHGAFRGGCAPAGKSSHGPTQEELQHGRNNDLGFRLAVSSAGS